MHKITIKYFPLNPCECVSVVFTSLSKLGLLEALSCDK